MFQSPLYYLLNAPLYLLISGGLETAGVVQVLRIIPFACGLAQLEITCRLCRRAFPGRDSLQCVALLVGGWTPMALWLAQGIGNETLAGCLTAWTVLLAVQMLCSTESSWREDALLGLVWGLAMLAKVTPVLLGPALLVAGLYRGGSACVSSRSLRRVCTVFATALAVCGWYYLRNWFLFGHLFVGGWDAGRGIVWWQDPGYRTISHMTAFGTALCQPVFAGVHGLWDGVYSTVWCDGFLSGVIDYNLRPPWNYQFLIAGALLALWPTLLIIAGILRALVRPSGVSSHPVVTFAAVCVVTYLAALILLYFRVPNYSTAKGTYLLGLLPCFGLLAAAGAEPLLRARFSRAALAAWLTCWSFASLAAFCF